MESSSGRSDFSPSPPSCVLPDELLVKMHEWPKMIADKLDKCNTDCLQNLMTVLFNHGLFDADGGSTTPISRSSPHESPSAWKKAAQKSTLSPTNASSPVLGRHVVTLGRKSKASQDVPVAVQEAPAAPSVSLDQKLKSLLEEPVTSPEVVKFVAYLESVFAVENFHFLKEVSAFQLECAHGTAKSKERKAKKIYETFFSESSPSLINMSHKSALPVHTRFGPLPSTIFDLAVKQVRLNLQDDILVRYLRICEKEDEDNKGRDRSSKSKIAVNEELIDNKGRDRSSKSKIAVNEELIVAEPPEVPVDYNSLNVVVNPLMGMKKGGSGFKSPSSDSIQSGSHNRRISGEQDL